MTYAAVASLSETIDLILKYHEESISPQFKNQITYLHKQIIFLRSFLEESPDEALTWEERIGEVTNKAEDIVEILLSDSLLDSSEPEVKKIKYEHKLRYDFDELERVTEEVESIVRGVRERHRETVGSLNDDSQHIIDRLCGGARGLQTFSIVGSGGIGKTTLAKNVYNHPSIVQHFDTRGWVTISQNYSMREILSGLLSSMNKLVDKSSFKADDELFARLHHILWGQRYLIVLDDLWSAEVWDKLESRIPRNLNGSRVLVTTRILDVAACVGFYTPIHHMCLMDVDQSWDLLRHRVFEGNPSPPKLEYIGKMIARSCRGLPLAIEVLSGILAAHRTQAEWEDIAENVLTAINCEDNEHILRILHLSYTYLPHHLRPCFLYLGMFPEDHEIRVSKLIKLWVAEGFVNESEETGEEYLEELVNRSLVSVSKRNKYNGRMKIVSIHDLVWDFCTRQAQLDKFFLHVSKFLVAPEAIQLQRRMSAADYDNILQNFNGSTVRTIICLEDEEQGGIQRWLEYFRLLRILDLSEGNYLFFQWNELRNRIFEKFHLRYLAFAVDWISLFRLPKAISNLENLQTLVIRSREDKLYVRGHLQLPVEIWRMRQLRHVVVHSCALPSQEKEEATYALENLQTLNEAEDFICSRETLQMIPNLKKLCIYYTGWGDYELHNLKYFQKLEILKIEMDWSVEERQRIIPVAFPRTLKKLSLRGLKYPWEEMKIVASLPNLQELKLRDDACIGSTWETNGGGFPQLQFLLIERSDLEHWITQTSHFPRLNCLVLRFCCLTEVPIHIIRQIQTLELIELD